MTPNNKEVGPVWTLLRWLARAVLPPLILLCMVALALREPVRWWLHGEEIYDREAIREWVCEARISASLPDLVRDYVTLAKDRLSGQKKLQTADPADRD